VCGEEKHNNKLFFCKKFKGFGLAERKTAVKKVGAFRVCLGCHDVVEECTDRFLCNREDCQEGTSSDHHYLLCPKWEQLPKGKLGKCSERVRELTEEQKLALSKCSPEAAAEIKKAFSNSNKTSVTRSARKDEGRPQKVL